MSDSALARCRVVLVRPHYAGNVGAATRVMRNFGPRDLALREVGVRAKKLTGASIAG